MFLNQPEKVKTGFWLLSQNKILNSLFYLLLLFLPTQFGKHFWPNYAFVFGLRLDYLSPTIYLTDIFIGLIFLLYFPKLISKAKKLNKKYLIAYVVLLLSLIIGALMSKNPLAGFYGIIKFLEFSFLVFFVGKNFKVFNKTILIICFFTGIIFESLLAFFQYLNQGSIGGIFYLFGERAFNAQTPGIANASINGQLILRPYATFPHPNVLAAFLIIAMFYLLLLVNNRTKKILVAGVILGTATLLLTLSRTAIFLWLIYLIVLFGIPLVKKYKNRFSNMKFLIGVIIVIALMMSLYFVFQNSFFVQRFSLAKLSDESLTQRQLLINQSVYMITTRPLFGVGINNFFNNLSFSKEKLLIPLIQPVHNIFLLIFSETGLIGFTVSVWFFYQIFKVIQKINLVKERNYLMALIFLIVFLGLFDHYFLTIQQGQLLLSIIIGTVLSYRKS